MSRKNLLFITEGEIDEPKFIDKYFKKCYPNIEYNYYTYTTDIHTLARLLFKDEENIDEYLDIKSVLKENEKNEYRRQILSKRYSDIILVFDFDPHATRPEFGKIYKMLEFFNDSTNNGKLYINYPMMQSYRHICIYPEEDCDFKDRTIDIKKCSKYKQIVDKESCFQNINKYNYPKIMKIVGYQLKKANYILNKEYTIPNEETLKKIDLNNIYNIQCKKKDEESNIYVLNTFMLHLVEYNPKRIIENIRIFE